MEAVAEFLQWLSAEDLLNIENHGEEHGDGDVEPPLEGVADGEDEASDGEEEGEASDGDEGVEEDCVDMVGESATLIKTVSAGEVNDAIYCTTVCFTRIPTVAKNYLLCHLCYARYGERCHPLTKHTQASVHRTTDISCVPRLYCGACGCNLFTTTNITTCTQCNNVKKDIIM